MRSFSVFPFLLTFFVALFGGLILSPVSVLVGTFPFALAIVIAEANLSKTVGLFVCYEIGGGLAFLFWDRLVTKPWLTTATDLWLFLGIVAALSSTFWSLAKTSPRFGRHGTR